MSRQLWRMLTGTLVTLVGIVLFFQQMGWVSVSLSGLSGGLVLILGGVIFLALWMSSQEDWWPLIPGCSMLGWGIAAVLGAFHLPGAIGAAVGFGATALAFFLVFLRLGVDEGWWALIPGGIVASWGVASVLGALGVSGTWVSLVGFLGSAATFALIFSLNTKENWWALIPGGVMGLMAVVIPLSQVIGEEWIAPLILLGIAGAFVVVRLLSERNSWALVPAGVLTVVALFVSPRGSALWLVWPLLLIGGGVLLIVRAVVRP